MAVDKGGLKEMYVATVYMEYILPSYNEIRIFGGETFEEVHDKIEKFTQEMDNAGKKYKQHINWRRD